MAKTIAIWGSPHSGKTTFATKLARSIYEEYQSTVIILYTDMETPTLPVIFPNEKSENMTSVGKALAELEVTQDNLVKQIMTVKGKVNLGFLGFKDGENKYTYPKFEESKVLAMFSVLDSLCDYVIVDCTSNLGNPIARVAIKCADQVIRLASPELSSISYFSSQLPLYGDPMFRLEEHVTGLNVPNEDLYMPIEDAKKRISDVRFTVPFSRDVKQQMLDGRLYFKVADKKFNEKFKAIVEKVV